MPWLIDALLASVTRCLSVCPCGGTWATAALSHCGPGTGGPWPRGGMLVQGPLGPLADGCAEHRDAEASEHRGVWGSDPWRGPVAGRDSSSPLPPAPRCLRGPLVLPGHRRLRGPSSAALPMPPVLQLTLLCLQTHDTCVRLVTLPGSFSALF